MDQNNDNKKSEKQAKEKNELSPIDDNEVEKLKAVEEKYKREFEDEKFQEEIAKRVTEAENTIRNYELEMKKGNFDLEPPYEEVLNIYKTIRKDLLERNWIDQANVYLNQMKLLEEKIQKDTKLRQIEAQKKEKEKEYLDSFKVKKEEVVDLQKLKAVEVKHKKEFEDEQFQKQIDERINDAEKMIRAYELEIKKGNFEIEPPYQVIIDIYRTIREEILERNWIDQANVYLNQIKLLEEKIQHDAKLREIEAKKSEKDKLYQDSLKLGQKRKLDVDKMKAVEEKITKDLEDDKFQEEITQKASDAEKMIRTYELEIKKGNFEIEPPYHSVINIYSDIKAQLLEHGWNDQAMIYVNQINLLRDKIVQDEKLRDVEAKKREKDATYLESMKFNKRKKSDYTKSRAVDDKIKKELEDVTFQNQIDEEITEANKLIRTYEYEIKKGNFEIEPPYQKVIKSYESIREKLLERNWNDQAMIYTNQIKLLKEKYEKDKVLRDIEAHKTEKEDIYLESMKLSEIKTSDYKKLLAAQEKIRKSSEDEAFQKEIDDRASEAEKMIRNYEKEIKKGKFEMEPPFQKTIEIYEEIRSELLKRNWKEQAMIYLNQIKLINEKSENDKLLREIEQQKRQKQIEYEEQKKLIPDETQIIKDVEKLKGIEAKRRKEYEDERFQEQITTIVNKAEELARKYEFAIRQGKFEEVCPYQEIIDIYNEVKDKVVEKGWSEQALIYTKQINLYIGKLEKDKKLREIESQKALKQKEYEDSIKIKKDDKQIRADLDRLKIAEEQYHKELEDANFETEITKMVDRAEEMARKYEFAIRQGKFEEICPYQEIIDIYTEAKNKLVEKGWVEQVNIYTRQINFYIDKLENDKKLREIEAQKAHKQRKFEEIIKSKKEDKQLEDDIERLKQVEDQYKRELEEENFENEIANMVDEADSMARRYEIALRKGKFEESCPYPVIIEIYDQVRIKLMERGWNDEATIYKKQVQIYQEKLEQDKKLREIEELKSKKQKEFKDQFLRIKEEGLSTSVQRIKAGEEKLEVTAEEEKFSREISKMVDEAEEMARKYEISLRKGKFEVKCPYPEIIETYTEIYHLLKEKQWIDQALVYSNQIKLYQDKLEKDERLREFEAQKEVKSKQMEEFLKAKVSSTIDLEKVRELEAIKTEREEKLNEGFKLIDKAENLVKDYELKLKLEKDKLLYESPYEKAISLYRQARKIFQDDGWENEANQLVNTISFYKNKQQNDDKLRELERGKLEKEKIKISSAKPIVDKELKERKKRALVLEEQKRMMEELSSEAFRIIDEAERLAKRYELELKDGSFPDCPYEKIIKMYRNAKITFEEIGWEDQAASIIDTIGYYKQKSEADKKLRALEVNKIEKQKKEEEEQRRILKRVREKEEKQLRLKQEALLARNEKEREYEDKKFEAFNFMDQAKRQLNQDNFNSAIELYRKSEKIFSKLGWSEGLKMVHDSILLINKQKQEFESREKALKEEKVEKLRLERELEKEITKSKELERLQQELKREEMLKLQKQKEKESQISENAYSLLEEGTNLLEKKKFKEAYDKYIAAQEIFKELDWFHEVNRINNDLLIKLQNEEIKQKRLEEYKKKKIEEKQELENLLLEAERQSKEIEEAKVKEKRERLTKSQISDKLKDKIEEDLARANIEIQNGRYNKGVLKFKEIIKMMERVGWEKEIIEVKNQLYILKNKSHIPIITLEDIEKKEITDKFKVAYEALDKAQVSLLKNRLMKAISELNEAKFNLEETKVGVKYIEEIESKLIELKEIVDKKKDLKDISDIEGIEIEEGKPIELSSELAYEYMDKCKKEERRNNFKKAIEYATTAKEIFVKLGPEWAREIMSITRYISTLENKQIAREESFKRRKEELEVEEKSLKEEEEEFKKRISARREERKRRIQKLMKSKD